MTLKYHIYLTQTNQHIMLTMIWYSKNQHICQTFILEAIDIPHGSMPLTYHLPNDPNKIIT
jgi:hypothetical protein